MKNQKKTLRFGLSFKKFHFFNHKKIEEQVSAIKKAKKVEKLKINLHYNLENLITVCLN